MPVPAPTPTTNVEVVPGPNPGETTVTVTTYTDATKSEVESVEIRTGKGDGDAAWDKYSTRVIEQFSAGQVVRIIEVGVTWDRDTPHVGRRTTRVKVVEKYGYPTKVRERETFRIVQLEEGEIKYCFITENWYDGSARRGICFSLPLLQFRYRLDRLNKNTGPNIHKWAPRKLAPAISLAKKKGRPEGRP